jgi:serine/threonine protein kinase
MARCEQCNLEVSDDLPHCPRCGSEPTAAPDALLGTAVLGRYRIVRMLAEGGMGRVYLAEQSVGTVVRRVAIKVLRRQLCNDRQLVSRFSREAETLVRLTHPNTVQLFDFGALPDGTLALVMEYVEGHSLARELLKGALSPARAERLLSQACGALQEAHAHGIVHRDLKPDNMLVAERVGHGDFVKVLDFGIAQVSSPEPAAATTKLTQQGMIIGTPQYMSPEQFSGSTIDARSDIYSLGVVAYEMLTARLPFEAKTPWEWASRHLTATPAALPVDDRSGLLPRHARAIRAALAKDPDDRPQTVAAFLQLITSDEAIGVSPAHAQSAAAAASARPSTSLATVMRSRRFLWPVVALGALVLVVSLGFARRRPDTRSARLPPPTQTALPTLPLAHGGVVAAPVAMDLPTGLPAPGQPAEPSRSPRRDARERRADPRAASVEPSPLPVAADVPPARSASSRDTSNKSPMSSSAADATSALPASSAAKKPVALPDDLAQRIGQVQAASLLRVETAVGLYQAAAGRYGNHAALAPLRTELALRGEKRIKELLSEGHCAQAQALFRALRSITAAAKVGRLFGEQCPLPREAQQR